MEIKNLSISNTPQGSVEMRDDISRMLKMMREIQKPEASASPDNTSNTSQITESSFQTLLDQARSAVDQVNHLEETSTGMKNAYIAGDANVSLTDVVLASQKSSLAFQALINIRNKLLDAYRQVMDMPV